MKPLAYRSTISALAIGQLFTWAALFYAFSSFVLPMQREFGWGKAELMGAFTLGMTVWGISSYAAGAAIDRGQGRLRGPDTPARASAHDAGDDATLHEALRHRSFWLLTVTFTLYAFVSAALWAHIMPAFAAKGTGEAQALAVVMWVGPAQVAGRVVYLWLGRHITPRALGLLVLAGTPASLAVFALADHLVGLLLFALLFGISNGLSTIVRGNVVPDYFGREHVGRISGAMTAIALISRAAAPLAAAWLLLAVPGYREVMLVLALLGVGSWATFALARPPLR